MTYRHLAVVNQSYLDDGVVSAATAAIQIQVVHHLQPAWDLNANVVFYPNGVGIPAGSISIIVQNNSNQPGALGYHDFVAGIPVAYVFARTAAQNGVSMSSVMSHEILELLADPDINSGAQHTSSEWYAMEVGDPVEQSSYIIPVSSVNVEVSNFVFPAWFSWDAPPPYDHLRLLTKPFQLLKGGSYIGVWTQSSGWTSRNAEGVETFKPDPDDTRRCLRPFQRRDRFKEES